MQTVVVPCHPLSLAVLRTHYGTLPIILANHDPFFELLSGTRRRDSSSKTETFTAEVSLVVNDHLARHIQLFATDIARRMYRHHKMMLCWYVVAQVRLKGFGGAKPAVRDWLDIHGVDEDAYSVDTAYKLFQRFGWDLKEKNGQFSKQILRKMEAGLHRKSAARAKSFDRINPLRMRMKDVEVQLIVARFLTAYSTAYNRVPVCLPKHISIYLYKEVQGYTEREVAAKLNLKHSGVHHALVSMRNRLQHNPTVRRLMEEALALPERL